MDYLRSDHRNLLNMLGPILVDVAWSDQIKDAGFTALKDAAHDSLQSPFIYDLAVTNAMAQFKP